MAGGVDAAPGETGSRRTNLTVQLTTFVGRERERAEIGRLLAGSRLLTLTGPGGIGKTRLALEVAGDAVAAYQDGVWLVELASLADADLVAAGVASVLQIGEIAGQPLAETLAGALGDRQLLIVLDNCEHVAQASAELADRLLRSCPRLRILATSREALRVPGEVIWRVPSLGVPDPRVVSGTDAIAACEAVTLFVDRARLALPSFALGDRNAAGVAEICRRLDGIPLAIELAAARLAAFGVDQLAARLDDRFQLLTGGSRTALSRHQTLRRTIDWSHELLAEPERRLLRRLAAFAGGWTLDAAEIVCGGAVLDPLAGLIEKSLVMLDEGDAPPRYQMLETVRQYAEERLVASGEAAEVRRRHFDWFLALAERAAPELSGPDQADWFERLEREHDNLRAALQWALDRRAAEPALKLSGALGLFWIVRGHRAEGWRWFEQTLALDPSAGGSLRGRALGLAGYLARLRNDATQAVALGEEALAVRREVGDRPGIARSLHDLAELARDRGEYARAMPLLDEALVIQREIGDRGGLGMTMRLIGRVAYEQGDNATARANEEESLALFRELGDEHRVAHELDFLGVVIRAQGERRLAAELHEQGLAIFERIADKDGLAQVLLHLGRLALDRRDGPGAAALCLESLVLWQELDAPNDAPPTFEALAEAALASGRAERAARLLGAAEALRGAACVPLPPAERHDVLATTATARAKLGTAAFEAARAAGRAMSFAEVVEYARAAVERTPPGVESTVEPGLAAATSPLTPREREVAVLVARGLSNRQIGEALVITEGTANLHVKHILGKLGFASRAEIAAWAVRQERVAPAGVEAEHR